MQPPVVVVIANPFEARLVSRAVEAVGMVPVVAEGGEGALELFDETRSPVVVLAQGLYYADEGELLASLRSHAAAPWVLIIGNGRLAPSSLVADDVVVRPINPTQLGEKLIELTQRPPRAPIVLPVPVPIAPPISADAPPAASTSTDEEEPWWEEMPSPAPLLFAGDAPDPSEMAGEASEPSEMAGEAHHASSVGSDDAASPFAPGSDELEGIAEEVAEPAIRPRAAHRTGIAMPAFSLSAPPTAAGAVAASGTATPAAGLAAAATSATGTKGLHPAAGVSSGRAEESQEKSFLDERPTRRPLDRHLAAVERKLFSQRPVEFATTDGPVEPPHHIGVDTLPGFDAQLGLRTPAPRAALDERRGMVPRSVTTSAARPGRDTQPSRGALSSALTTPDLDDRVGFDDLADSGELEVESLPLLLVRLHRAGYTGCLSLRRGEGEKSIFFDAGFPVHAGSNLPHDRLNELLWREGKITREQHAKSRFQAERTGRRIVDVLVDLSALKRDELFKVLRHHVEEIIYSCFGWDRGGWSLGREIESRDEKVSIAHPFAVAMEGIRRKYGLERLVKAVGPMTTALSATPSLWAVSSDAQISTGERDAIQLLRRGGARTVAELQAGGKLDQIGAYALVHGLLVIGGLSVGAATVADSAGSDEGVVDRERTLAKHAQVIDGDYFIVLGVSRAANGYEIRRAWERMRRDFAPDHVAPRLRDELGDKLGEIVEVVDEAWRALGEESRRDQYRAHLPD